MSVELEARSLTATRGGPRRVLDQVSLTIQRGEIIAVMGASGAGKSTLALALAGLIALDHGTISGAAVDRVGVVLQRAETAVFGKTVLDDAAAAQQFSGAPRHAARMHARAALDALGLDESFDARDPLGLSGGEQRRVAIAAVFAAGPRVLVLDEPSAGLDGHSRALVHRQLRSLATTGTALVVITHDPQEAADLADRLIVLAHGRIVHDGPSEIVLGDPHAAEALGVSVAPAVRVMREVAAMRGVQPQLVCRSERVAAELARVVRAGVAVPTHGSPPSSVLVDAPNMAPLRHRHDVVNLPSGPRVEPRAMLIATIVLVGALFAARSLLGVGVAGAASVLAVVAARPAVATLRAALRPMLLLAVLLVVAQWLVGGQHDVVLAGQHSVESGLLRSVWRVLQVFGVVLASLALTTVLRPVELADAIAWLFAPLRRVGVAVDDVALMLATALGFVPMLADELDRLQLAQAARGMRARGRGPRARFALSSMLLAPLLVVAVRRARLTAEAMHLRGYERGARRTPWRPRPLQLRDVLPVVAAALVMTAAWLV